MMQSSQLVLRILLGMLGLAIGVSLVQFPGIGLDARSLSENGPTAQLLSLQSSNFQYSNEPQWQPVDLDRNAPVTSPIEQKEPRTMNQPTIEQVKAAAESQLMAIPGVMGVGIGLNRDRQPCIKVYVNRQVASSVQQIPQMIEGYPVEVEVRGAFRAQ